VGVFPQDRQRLLVGLRLPHPLLTNIALLPSRENDLTPIYALPISIKANKLFQTHQSILHIKMNNTI